MRDAIASAAPAVKERPRQGTFSHVMRLVRLVAPYKGRWALATVALFVGTGVTLALPQPVRIMIDRALKGKDQGLLDLIAVLAVAGFVVMGALTMLRHYLMSWLGNRVVADLRDRAFRHLLRFPPGYFHERKTGELVSRLTDDIGAIQHTVGSELSLATRAALTIIGGMTILLFTSPSLTAVMLLLVPPVSFLAVFIGRKIRKRAREMQDLVASANSGLKEALVGIETVQTFNAEDVEAARYHRGVFGAFRASLSLALYRGGFIGAIQVAAFGAVTVILWIGGSSVIDGTLSFGAVAMFMMYTVMIASGLATLANVWGNLQRAIGASDRIFELLDEVPAIRDRQGARPLTAAEGRVALEGVSFVYPTRPDVTVLHDVSVMVSPGETVALVGRSGAGKSTITALVQRFWDPTAGVVRIDGHDVRDVKLEDLRRAIGTVAQDPVLFSGSIRDNIAYARPDAPLDDIIAAGRDAHIADFVESLPSGWDTLVGERGVKLSGGQRQRVAIARAILADPAILILDEATSHLDTENEALVHEALERLMSGRTTLIIAHRLSTVQNASRILVLDEGRVVESGSHDELLAAGGLYAKLTAAQILE